MITGMTNGRIKQLIALQERGRLRNKEGLFVAEGWKMFAEAPIEKLKEVYLSESLSNQLLKAKEPAGANENSKNAERFRIISKKLKQCEEFHILIETIQDDVFKKAADTQTPQGILFVMKQLDWSLDKLVKKAVDRAGKGGRAPLFLLLEDIQDPGNLGTMLRTAEGAGVDGVIMSKGTADIYNPKTIRSTMGSLYRVPFLYTEDLKGEIALLKKNGITVYAAHLQGKHFYTEEKFQGGSAFLIGNEGNGLSEEITVCADCLVKIPMEGKLESLNAAVAAALLMYEAAGRNRAPIK